MIPQATTQQLTEHEAWRRRFALVRQKTVELAAPLSPEDQQIQSMPDASPTKWHLAHTTWFFETFILREHCDRPTSPSIPHSPTCSIPITKRSASVIRGPSGACCLVRLRMMCCAIARMWTTRWMTLLSRASSALWSVLKPLVELGLHHEQQHQELILMDIKHAFSINPLLPAYAETSARDRRCSVPANGYRFPAAFTKSAPRAMASRSTMKVLVIARGWSHSRSQAGSSRMPSISNSSRTAAIAGPSSGCRTVGPHDRQQGWEAPSYWLTRNGGREIFTLAGVRPIDPAEPVCHVSYYEADAFARWAGKRLPREEEWEVAASRHSVPLDPEASSRLHPSASSASGLSQMFGECWQWTSSAYSGFPGYQPAAGAIGEYNGKFMSNQFVLRGSAAVTSAGHARTTYRNFFPPSARWAFSGIRLATYDV